MTSLPPCPKCQSPYTYQDSDLYVCPECAHEWSPEATDNNDESITDAHGTPLNDGDTITLIKDLKLKGSSSTLKVGTKIKSIRLTEGDHNIDCKVDGLGAIKLKSEFVKKI